MHGEYEVARHNYQGRLIVDVFGRVEVVERAARALQAFFRGSTEPFTFQYLGPDPLDLVVHRFEYLGDDSFLVNTEFPAWRVGDFTRHSWP